MPDRPISNNELTSADIADAYSARSLIPFAHTFDGYEYFGGMEGVSAVADRVRRLIRRGLTTRSIAQLRGALFYEARALRGDLAATDDRQLGYLRAIVGQIDRLVSERDVLIAAARQGQDGDRRERIGELEEAAGACRRCHASGHAYRDDAGRRGYPLFQPALPRTVRAVIVAEAPNLTDSFDPNKGYLTVDGDTDPSGVFLRQLLESVGVSISEVVVTNSVLCLPALRDGKYPVRAAMRTACAENLVAHIEAADPPVVVTLGNEALHALKVIERHDLRLKFDRGVLTPWAGRLLLPLYHPSLLGRKTRPAEMQMRDIEPLGMFA